jgi:catechol 2,3-dioxygenase-like lactoylglutathione lyase family enzyme
MSFEGSGQLSDVHESDRSAAELGGIGICVADVGNMTRFYAEGLGCQLDEATIPPESVTSRLGVVPDGLDMTVLTTPQGLRIKLVRSPRRDPEQLAPATSITGHTGVTYLTFYVDNVASTRTTLVQLGGVALSDSDLERMVAIVADPEGNLVELIRRPRK